MQRRLYSQRQRRKSKKLIEAAEFWARPKPTNQARKDLEERGAPQEVIDSIPLESEDFEVWPENQVAVDLFQRLASQWNWSSGGGCVGLNYQSLEFLFKLFKTKERKQIFSDIQTMEFAAIRVFNEKKE